MLEEGVGSALLGTSREFPTLHGILGSRTTCNHNYLNRILGNCILGSRSTCKQLTSSPQTLQAACNSTKRTPRSTQR